MQFVNELAFDWSAEDCARVIKTTGIAKMPVLGSAQTILDLAESAVRPLFYSDSNLIRRSSIDSIIFITPSPDYLNPGNSLLLANRMNWEIRGPHFDLSYGCSGIAYGLLQCALLFGYPESIGQRVDTILLVIGESGSKACHPMDRSTRVLFGDAAAALLIERSPGALNWIDVGSQPSRIWTLIHHGSATRPLPEHLTEQKLEMRGTELMSFIAECVPRSIEGLLQHLGLNSKELSIACFHQASLIVVEFLKRKLNLRIEQVPLSLSKYGNTGNASQLVTLVDHVSKSDQMVKWSAEHVLMSGFGAGLSWGTTIMNFDDCLIHPISRLSSKARS
jgi:3-oxoacyl-[acyl-carrier-protein] synthase-3